MPTISYLQPSAAPASTRRIYDDITRTYGLDKPRGIYLLMGHTPAHLSASWPRSRHCYGRDSCFTLKEKHLLTLAMSASHNCEYCVRSHTVRLQQLGATRAELAELLAIVFGASGCAKLAEGVRMGDDPTIRGPGDDERVRSAGPVSRLAAAFGPEAAEEICAVIAHSPCLLEALASLLLECFGGEGLLGCKFKHLVGLCVSACEGSDFFVKLHTSRLRDLGVRDEELVELVFLVDVVSGYNRYVQGVQVDVREGEKPWGAHAQANAAPSCCA